jgi:ribonuclease P protein component
MLSQKHRLSRSADVKKTTARGRSFFNPFFVIKLTAGTEIPRVTIIVSAKVSKKAVDRNRIKRIMRDELRKHLPHFKPGDYAFIVKPAAAKAESQQLRENLVLSLKSSKIVQ